MTLRARLLQAGVWTAGAHALELAIRLLTNLILTRLLFPEAFGLVAAAGSLLMGLALISDFGVRAAIIQNPNGDTETFLRSAWSFQISRGAILWLTLAAICGIMSLPPIHALIPVASVFSSPAFPLLTVLLGLALLVDGFESTSIPLNYRRLNYGRVIFTDIIGKILPAPITIILAWIYPTPWVLAAGALTASIIRVALSHTLVPGPPMRWEWNNECIGEIIHFGKWITLASIATFVSSQSDVLLFGLLLPGSFVGVYFIAKTLTDAIEGFIEKLNVSLTLPVLGEVLRQNPQNLRNRFYQFRFPIDFVAAVSGGFLCVAGSEIISTLYDPRYAQAGPVLQILGLGLAIYPLQLVRGAFTAIGKTHVVATVSIVQALSVASFLLLGFAVSGAIGAVAGLVFSRLVPAAAILYRARGQKWIGWQEMRLVPLFFFGLLAGEIFLRFIYKSAITTYLSR